MQEQQLAIQQQQLHDVDIQILRDSLKAMEIERDDYVCEIRRGILFIVLQRKRFMDSEDRFEKQKTRVAELTRDIQIQGRELALVQSKYVNLTNRNTIRFADNIRLQQTNISSSDAVRQSDTSATSQSLWKQQITSLRQTLTERNAYIARLEQEITQAQLSMSGTHDLSSVYAQQTRRHRREIKRLRTQVASLQDQLKTNMQLLQQAYTAKVCHHIISYVLFD